MARTMSRVVILAGVVAMWFASGVLLGADEAPAAKPASDAPAKAPATPAAPKADASAPAKPAAPDKPEAKSEPEPVAITLDKGVQSRDRYLFMGDEITQQMFFTRATAAGLLAVKPEMGLRFFNGGKDDATAESALATADDLLDISNPTVVFLFFGLNDGQGKAGEATKPLAQAYEKNLTALVKMVQARKGVRLVVVMSPPAIQAGLTEPMDPNDYNATLFELSKTAKRVAGANGCGFVDAFEITRRVYLGQAQSGGESMTYMGRLPNELMHIILASHVIKALGVTAADLEATGWSPLRAREMRRVRGVLALNMRSPDTESAQASRDLYVTITRFDETFFRYWRLAGRNPSSPTRATLVPKLEEDWGGVKDAAAMLRKADLSKSKPASGGE